tara:strand:- start:3530 stop:4678 length:1149 start_codon:yes stop_codon:yes gene_type:complete
MTPSHVLIISFSPIAADARVLKQIAMLREDHTVTTCGYGPHPVGAAHHVQVPEDLAIWRYPRALVVGRQYSRAYWSNHAIAYAKDALRGRSFDVVLANDVDSVGLALEVPSRFGVHADLHEYSPRQHDEMLRFRLFVRPFVEWMCRRFVARAASWTTVSAGLAREYARVFGFTPEVVTNAAPYVALVPTKVERQIRVVHSGAALRNRHLAEIIAGVSATPDATLDLYLTPNDAGYLAEIRELASSSGGKVSLREPVPYAALARTLNEYDIGVHLLPPVNFNNRWALPNKLFDYVQARLGVIVGPSPEMADYVRRFQIGMVTDDFSAAALTSALETVSPDEVASWKHASHQRARDLSSESQVRVWRAAIDRLVTRPDNGSSLD